MTIIADLVHTGSKYDTRVEGTQNFNPFCYQNPIKYLNVLIFLYIFFIENKCTLYD